MKAVLLCALLSAALLAGCSAKVPTGTLTSLSYAPTLEGSARVHYEKFQGANAAAGQPAPVGDQQCAQNQLPGQVPVQHCTGPWTTVAVNVTAPKQGDQTYSVWLVNATGHVDLGSVSESDIGEAKTARYTVSKNFTADYTGRFTTLQLRVGDLVFATGPVAEGPNAIAVNAAATAVTVGDGAFTGHDLTGTISGLQGNVTYMGMLYLPGADGKAQADPAESFAIAGNGPFHYTSPNHDISDFVEFHVHVGTSKVNLYKASIQVAGK